ncbi:MAG: hypothetical protein JNL97_06825 [Verrucomicrobiales bacterium]|nr:hypothetical protein [Verrucomicrobiales bacterium]
MKSALALILVGLASAPGLRADPAPEHKVLVNVTRSGVALQGYDPVAYFTAHRPVRGYSRFASIHDGATYWFDNPSNKARFDAAPDSFVPAFGGFCGYAASIGKVRPANPLLWSIVDGRLVVQHTKGAVELWEKDVPGNKRKADRLWPRLVEAKAGRKHPIDSLLGKSVLAGLE